MHVCTRKYFCQTQTLQSTSQCAQTVSSEQMLCGTCHMEIGTCTSSRQQAVSLIPSWLWHILT